MKGYGSQFHHMPPTLRQIHTTTMRVCQARYLPVPRKRATFSAPAPTASPLRENSERRGPVTGVSRAGWLSFLGLRGTFLQGRLWFLLCFVVDAPVLVAPIFRQQGV